MPLLPSGARSLVLLLGLLLSATPIRAPAITGDSWSDGRDNKPVAELELMTDDELKQLAASVCNDVVFATTDPGAFAGAKLLADNPAHRTITAARVRADGEQYLTTISRVLRKNHHGKIPKWMEEILHSVDKADAGACLDILAKKPRK